MGVSGISMTEPTCFRNLDSEPTEGPGMPLAPGSSEQVLTGLFRKGNSPEYGLRCREQTFTADKRQRRRPAAAASEIGPNP